MINIDIFFYYRSVDKTGSSWLIGIREGLKRAFLPQGEEKTSHEVTFQQDIEHGQGENEV